MTAIVTDAAERSWQAAAWWLERRRPHDLGRYQHLTIADTRAASDAMARAEGLDPDVLWAEVQRIARKYTGEQP